MIEQYARQEQAPEGAIFLSSDFDTLPCIGQPFITADQVEPVIGDFIAKIENEARRRANGAHAFSNVFFVGKR